MATILYFQPVAKTFAPEKLAGVRDIIEKRHHRVQIIEEKPTWDLVEELWAFWNPLGAIIDCGGEYNNIDAAIFSSRPVVFIGHNPDTLPKSCLLVSNDQRETARAEAGVEVVGGVSGDAKAAVESYLAGTLAPRADFKCNHHHHEERHTCGRHHHG